MNYQLLKEETEDLEVQEINKQQKIFGVVKINDYNEAIGKYVHYDENFTYINIGNYSFLK